MRARIVFFAAGVLAGASLCPMAVLAQGASEKEEQPRFGRQWTLEIGGSLSYLKQTVDLEQKGAESVKINDSALTVGPLLGLFVYGGLQLLMRPTYMLEKRSSGDFETKSDMMGIYGGLAYNFLSDGGISPYVVVLGGKMSGLLVARGDVDETYDRRLEEFSVGFGLALHGMGTGVARVGVSYLSGQTYYSSGKDILETQDYEGFRLGVSYTKILSF